MVGFAVIVMFLSKGIFFTHETSSWGPVPAWPRSVAHESCAPRGQAPVGAGRHGKHVSKALVVVRADSHTKQTYTYGKTPATAPAPYRTASHLRREVEPIASTPGCRTGFAEILGLISRRGEIIKSPREFG